MMARIKEFLGIQVPSHSAYMETAIAASLQIMGAPAELYVGRDFPGNPSWPVYLSVLSAGFTLLVLFATRLRPRVSWANWLFILNACVLTYEVHLRAFYYAEFAEKWVPFQTNKLACLVSALLAPSFWSGMVAILVYAFGAVVTFFQMSSELRADLAVGEPAITVVFTFAGVLTLFSRYRRIQMEHRIVQLETETRAAERFARTVLRIRDMMNTPLQVIEFSVTILRNGAGGREDALKGLDNAARRLAELNNVLKEHPERDVQA